MSYNDQDQKKLTISAIFAGIASGFLLAFLVLFMVRFMEFKTINFVILAVVVTVFPMCYISYEERVKPILNKKFMYCNITCDYRDLCI